VKPNHAAWRRPSVALISMSALALALTLSPTPTLALDGPTAIRSYFGGYGHGVLSTDDGGAIVPVTWGAGGDCCHPSLVKLRADGSVEWQKVYDAPGLSGANNAVPTLDGGYLLSGEGIEFQVVKVDAAGDVLWARSYGDGGYTHLRVLEASDGSILLTGATTLGDGGETNGRAMRLDADGNVLWEKVYGRPFLPDYLTAATETYDGNFLMVGSLRGDHWVMEVDRDTGDIVWQKIHGGPGDDVALVVTRALKRYYVVVGASESFSGAGMRDWWVNVIAENGRLAREFAIGGLDAEDPHAVLATSDGGFIVGGGTGSFGAGFADLWLVKFDSRVRVEWQKAYGRADRTDHAWEIEETSDGYHVVGDSYAFPIDYDFTVMKIDPNGDVADATCAAVVDTDAVPVRTNATTNEAGALTWDVETKAVDLRVAVTALDWPIATCAP